MPEPRRYTVTSLHQELEGALRQRYRSILVEAEVAQINRPASGHAYLLLRDKDRFRGDAVLSGVVWRDDWRRFHYQPAVGDRVVCRGRIGVYPARGLVQIYVSAVAPAGRGAMAQEIERRKQRLMAEGLLDERRKRPLPRFPRVVGLATSPAGAAVRDFLKVARQRHPGVKIVVGPCTVQGEHAAGSVIRAIDTLVEHGQADVIVVTRGGGSKEDLLAFQDEYLARAIAHCPIPVVSAVGHEIDTTIADLVADAVAPTPSAAAVVVLPDMRAWLQRVDEAELALTAGLRRMFGSRRERVRSLEARLRHPRERVLHTRARAVELSRRLERSALDQVERRRQVVGAMEERLERVGTTMFDARRRRLESAEGRLGALSPTAVLGRGYAIVTGPRGVVDRVDAAVEGEALRVRVADGAFGVRVDRTASSHDAGA